MLPDWIAKAFATAGVTGVAALVVAGILSLFSRRFAKKDKEHSDMLAQTQRAYSELVANKDNQYTASVASISNNFMQFIEREGVRQNTINNEFLQRLQAIHQQQMKSDELLRDKILAIQTLLAGQVKMQADFEVIREALLEVLGKQHFKK
jgi:hypothetical protein